MRYKIMYEKSPLWMLFISWIIHVILTPNLYLSEVVTWNDLFTILIASVWRNKIASVFNICNSVEWYLLRNVKDSISWNIRKKSSRTLKWQQMDILCDPQSYRFCNMLQGKKLLDLVYFIRFFWVLFKILVMFTVSLNEFVKMKWWILTTTTCFLGVPFWICVM